MIDGLMIDGLMIDGLMIDRMMIDELMMMNWWKIDYRGNIDKNRWRKHDTTSMIDQTMTEGLEKDRWSIDRWSIER